MNRHHVTIVTLQALHDRDADCRCGGKELDENELRAIRNAIKVLERSRLDPIPERKEFNSAEYLAKTAPIDPRD